MDISIKPLLSLDKEQVEFYWQTLYMHDTLKYRICDVVDPTWSDVIEMIVNNGRQMFCILHSKEIRGEFMLENLTGLAAQVHFSMHPENKLKQSLQMAKEAMKFVFTSDLRTLYGLTPTPNRAACLFTLKAGFTKIGVLPNGINYMGETVDAMISMKVSNGRG